MGVRLNNTTTRFAREIHVGLLGLILVLLSLNFISNYFLYRQKQSMHDALAGELRFSALVISRIAREFVPLGFPDSTASNLKRRYGLAHLALEPTTTGSLQRLKTSTGESDFRMTRRGEELFVLTSPVEGPGPSMTLSVGVNASDLAYIEDASRTILYAGLLGTLIVCGIYIALYRFLVRPIRLLTKAAEDAGHASRISEGSVDALVEQYREIIADLKQKEVALKHLNQVITERAETLEGFNEYLLTSMNAGLISCDRDGRIRSINPYALTFLGRVPGEVSCRPVDELLGLDESASLELKEELGQGRPLGWRETTVRPASEEERIIAFSAAPITSDNGSPLGFYLLFSEITELVALRRELEQSRRQASLGEMAAGLAHQLRNSLGAISGYGKLLERRTTGEPAAWAQSLSTEVGNAAGLIDRFLSISRPLQVNPEQADLIRVLHEIVETFSIRAEYAGRDVHIRGPHALWTYVDPLLFKQVMVNLIENGLQASADTRGSVTISVDQLDSDVRIKVIDKGRGIPPDVQERLFTPFYSTRPDGTGLGLILARRIVEMHRGRLTILSTAGDGTVCIIDLPMSHLAGEITVTPQATSAEADFPL